MFRLDSLRAESHSRGSRKTSSCVTVQLTHATGIEKRKSRRTCSPRGTRERYWALNEKPTEADAVIIASLMVRVLSPSSLRRPTGPCERVKDRPHGGFGTREESVHFDSR